MTPQVSTTAPDAAVAAQHTFRAVMRALAEPGSVHEVTPPAPPCEGLSPAATAIARTLLDFETTVFVLARDAARIAADLRFHTGVRTVATFREAAFVFIPNAGDLPPLDDFAQGTLDYPDRSTTVVIDVSRITPDVGWRLTGPGIATQKRIAIEPLPSRLLADLASNRARFPLGVDIVFCAGAIMAALPRSTRVEG